jgi:hypothetical protein
LLLNTRFLKQSPNLVSSSSQRNEGGELHRSYSRESVIQFLPENHDTLELSNDPVIVRDAWNSASNQVDERQLSAYQNFSNISLTSRNGLLTAGRNGYNDNKENSPKNPHCTTIYPLTIEKIKEEYSTKIIQSGSGSGVYSTRGEYFKNNNISSIQPSKASDRKISDHSSHQSIVNPEIQAIVAEYREKLRGGGCSVSQSLNFEMSSLKLNLTSEKNSALLNRIDNTLVPVDPNTRGLANSLDGRGPTNLDGRGPTKRTAGGGENINSDDKFFGSLPKDNLVWQRYSDNSEYFGEIADGKRNGKGRMTYFNGGMFEGSWKNGKMHGFGKLFYPNGKLAYDGEWFEEKFDGKGVIFNEEIAPLNKRFEFKNFDGLANAWIKYEGEFRDDKKSGIGVLQLSNGERYIGGFQEDSVHGKGAFYTLDGRVVEGLWVYNRLVSVTREVDCSRQQKE